MKKKVIATVLAGSLLMMPVSVFADDDDDYLHTLSFDKIKTEMEARSLIISSMWEQVSDGADKIDESEDMLKGSLSTMESSLTATKQKLDEYGALAETEAGKGAGADPEKLEYYSMMATAYGTIAGSLQMNISSLKMNLASLEAQQDNLWKSYIQVDQGKNQAIRGAQQLFLGYFTAEQGRDELKSNLDLLQSKLKVAKLQESLGMATAISTLEAEIQIKELTLTLDSLNKSLETLKGNINVMLGQDFDTELTLVEPSEVTRSMLRDMDYDEDLEDALIQSYDVRLAEESDDIRQAEKDFTLSFYQAYQNVQDKQKALELAQEKLSLEQKKYDHNYLMHSLGLISKFDFDGLNSLYRTKVNAVETAERELLQAYTDYEWMKKGLKVSASTGGSSSSSASAAPSASGMGS